MDWQGVIITTSIFGVGGIGYSLSGCFLKSAQNKLAKQVYHKKKLKEVLRATNINAGQKFWESTSKSSSGVYSSVYGSSASSKEEGTKQSEKSSTTETYDSTTGLRTGYMDNKGSGRINNVYDEHGNNIGWVSDTGGDMLDVHYNDGSKGRIDRK